MKAISSFSLLLLFVIIAQLFGASCANIVPPQGGPRDTLPPRVLSADPRDSTLHFRNDRITFTFDEYVDLQDVSNNLLFTPLFQNNPRVDVKGKTITVNFKDTLEPNTTYILNFGNAIKDFNEGNILKGYTYTFSTGAALDSLEIKGRVIMAQTGLVDSTLIVVLHKNLKDSAVMNQRPMYATRLDANGSFHFRNLPAGIFAVYAIGDAGISRRYQNKTQSFAFLDSTVNSATQDSILTLYAYKEVQPAVPAALPGVANPPARGRGDNRLIFTTNLVNNQQNLDSNLVIKFATPLRTLDSTKILLSTDSTFHPAAFTFDLDSARKELALRSDWKGGTKYNLVLDREFAIDTAGRRLLKSDTLFFNTRSAADYGSVALRFKNLDSTKNPNIQFVQNQQIMFTAPVKNGTFSYPRFAPGDYELRILYDTNNNGKWDPGQFFGTKRQPELVRRVGENITVKAGANNSFERSL